MIDYQQTYKRVLNKKDATHFQWRTSSSVGFIEGAVLESGSDFFYNKDNLYKDKWTKQPKTVFIGVFPIELLDNYKKKWGQITYYLKLEETPFRVGSPIKNI
jgi:hypothetical protein